MKKIWVRKIGQKGKNIENFQNRHFSEEPSKSKFLENYFHVKKKKSL